MNSNYKAYLVPQDKKGWSKNEIILHNGTYKIADSDSNEYISHIWQAQRLIICDEKADRKVGDWWTDEYYGNDHKLFRWAKPQEELTPNQKGKVIASFPPLDNCYELTPSDIRWWIEINCPSEVSLVIDERCKKKFENCYCKTKYDKRLSTCDWYHAEPKVTANCIELAKEKKVEEMSNFDYLEKAINDSQKQTLKSYESKKSDGGSGLPSTPYIEYLREKWEDKPQPENEEQKVLNIFSEMGNEPQPSIIDKNYEQMKAPVPIAQPSIQDGEIMNADDWLITQRPNIGKIEAIESYASYYHTAKSVVSKDDVEKLINNVASRLDEDDISKEVRHYLANCIRTIGLSWKQHLAKSDSVDWEGFEQWIIDNPIGKKSLRDLYTIYQQQKLAK